jgi:solute carrier family 25 phosphate transporter 23/24/25/41
VLSGSRLFGVRQDASGIRSVLSTFREIDAGGKGHITEADLAAFAEGHSLPQSYVRPFLDAVLQHHHDQQQQQQQQAVVADDAQQQLLLDSQRSGSGSSSSSDGDAVTFGAFRAFVASRELGLRQAFQAFDLDRDGHISHRDLSASLARVAICCPTSGCVMRPRREVVAQLLQRLNAQGEDR